MLDRDGTIVAERRYLADPEHVEMLPGVGRALRELREAGLGLVLMSNQSGIGRGYFGVEELKNVHRRLDELLTSEGTCLDGCYFCPHTPEERCACRKPSPGMIRQAANELGFDPRAGFFVGDKASDVGAGRAVGATTFLVRTGYGAIAEREGAEDPDFVVDRLLDVVPIIMDAITPRDAVL